MNPIELQKAIQEGKLRKYHIASKTNDYARKQCIRFLSGQFRDLWPSFEETPEGELYCAFPKGVPTTKDIDLMRDFARCFFLGFAHGETPAEFRGCTTE